MELGDLVGALAAKDALAVRQWLLDATRAGFDWRTCAEPPGLDERTRAIAAGVVELLAERAGIEPPAWTGAVAAASDPVWLIRAAASMPRLRRLCETEGPWPLRKRNVFAPPEFLTAA